MNSGSKSRKMLGGSAAQALLYQGPFNDEPEPEPAAAPPTASAPETAAAAASRLLAARAHYHTGENPERLRLARLRGGKGRAEMMKAEFNARHGILDGGGRKRRRSKSRKMKRRRTKTNYKRQKRRTRRRSKRSRSKNHYMLGGGSGETSYSGSYPTTAASRIAVWNSEGMSPDQASAAVAVNLPMKDFRPGMPSIDYVVVENVAYHQELSQIRQARQGRPRPVAMPSKPAADSVYAVGRSTPASAEQKTLLEQVKDMYKKYAKEKFDNHEWYEEAYDYINGGNLDELLTILRDRYE